jgi:uncharacterized BrkB/YihY/UPF0761 family membrane protein
VYGSIGVLIAIMVLIQINTFILLLGYDLNVALDLALNQARKNKARISGENKIIYIQDSPKPTE